MTEKEKQYLNKRLDELIRQRLDLHIQTRKLNKEIATIVKKLDKEIITDE